MTRNFIAEGDIDVKALLTRAIADSAFKNFAALAEALGLTQQALTAATARKTIAFPVLIKISKLTNKSLDYLVWGLDREDTRDGMQIHRDADNYEYINIMQIGGDGRNIRIPRFLIPPEIKEPEDLVIYLGRGCQQFIIDRSDRQLNDGTYAFSTEDNLIIKKCCIGLVQGGVYIEGVGMVVGLEPMRMLQDKVFGRVVWTGTPPPMPVYKEVEAR